MFGWFTPSCPVELRDKVWVEQRLQWLFERFDVHRILNAPRILPTREYFPDPYQGDPDDLPALFARVCQYMGADARRFQLKLFTEEERDDALGLYHQPQGEQPHVWLLKSLLPDQEAVIATLAHEVAHDLLLGAGLVSGDEEDHEHLTDLLPVVLGMGTFHANTAIKQSTTTSGNMSYWQIRRSGYLTAALCGYAMGVIEYLRQNKTAPSIAYLGGDAAGAMRSGCKYLAKTNDCLIDLERPSLPIARLTAEPLDCGVGGSASRCLYVLRTWISDEVPKPAQIEAALNCLQHKVPVIQSTAIEVLSKAQPAPEHVIDAVLAQVISPHPVVREKAAIAIGAFRLPFGYVTKEGDPLTEVLFGLMKDAHPETAIAAAVVLGSYGSEAIVAVPKILPLLVTALARHSDSADVLIGCLKQIVGNVKLYLEENPQLIAQGHYELIRDHLRAQRPQKFVELRPKRRR